MSSTALLLALSAATLHAGWNVLLAGASDVQAAVGVMLVGSVVLFAPVAALTWDVRASAAPYVVASGALELAYVVLLAAAYARSELSLVYPVARGLAPVLVLAGGAVFLAIGPSPLELVGVAAVAAGILLVRSVGAPDARGFAFGVAVAACIAGYTLVDSRGIRHADPIAYLVLVLAFPAAAYALALRRRLLAELSPRILAATVASFAAYVLVLLALRHAPPAPVAAVRETSIVIAVGLAALVLRERVGRVRLAGAAVVVAGVTLLSL